MMHAEETTLPDLAEFEESGKIVMLPIGGNIAAWSWRLAPLAQPEFHLYDRETPPETQLRIAAVESVNQRCRCKAMLTAKRSLENYLHPEAIEQATGVRMDVCDATDVAKNLARAMFRRDASDGCWNELSRRAKRRLAYRAKRRLHLSALSHMTPRLLEERGGLAEIKVWLGTIDKMVRSV